MDSCIFCKIVRGEVKSRFLSETAELVVIEDIYPKAPVHYLIIPKMHIVSMKEVDVSNSVHANLFLKMMAMIRELSLTLKAPGSFNLISNNGREAGQSVPHMHWHFISGRNIYETSIKL